jgi:hypothetical protein
MKHQSKKTRLRYLDDIIIELAEHIGEYVDEDAIATKISYGITKNKVMGDLPIDKKGIPKGRERGLFRTAAIHLEKLGLLYIQHPTEVEKQYGKFPKYIISYDGLMALKDGVGEREKSERKRNAIQTTLWIITMVGISISLILSIYNFLQKPIPNM